MIRLGNHASPKENQSLVIARFDREGNELIRHDLETLLSSSRVTTITHSHAARSSPIQTSSCDSASCSGASTPQRTSSPYPIAQSSYINQAVTSGQSLYQNAPLFTPTRALSSQAPAFQMPISAPIKVPNQSEQTHPLHTNIESTSYDQAM
jgi:hypothetical protein